MEWEKLISGYFDRTLTAEETQALYAWLREDPAHLKQFAAAALLHRGLLDHFVAEHQLQEQDAHGSSMADAMILPAMREEEEAPVETAAMEYIVLPQRPKAERVVPRGRRRGWGWAIAASVLVLIGISTWMAWPRHSVARLVAAEGARWSAAGRVPEMGGYLPAGDVGLEAGLVRLGFENGNEILVEGPARFAVRGELDLVLHRGKVSAVVSERGRGLCVRTSDALVTDLGTEFGVSKGEDATQVAVFQGKVTAAVAADKKALPEQVLTAGSGAEVSAAGVKTLALAEVATPFVRAMPSEIEHLKLVDLLAGGDGLGDGAEVGINAATGAVGNLPAVAERRATGQYARVAGHRYLDGTLIPAGMTTVDSAGHRFAFPETSRTSYGLIWGGVGFPWAREPRLFLKLGREDFSHDPSAVLLVHSNNGLTIDLQAVRVAHPGAALLAFRAKVGNSFVTGTTGENQKPARASVHVLVDGAARFEKLNFSNEDGAFEASCPLTAADRYLTLATTDGGDGFTDDWVLWTHPTLDMRSRNDARSGTQAHP